MTNPQLHEIWPARAYCGPAVLAALTGCDAKQDVRAWINAVRNRPLNRGITGMQRWEMAAVLASRGYGFERLKFDSHRRPWELWKDCPTLLQFAEQAKPRTFYIVNVTRHYVALLDGIAADNHVRAGCPVAEHPSARARVREALEILGDVRVGV